MIKNFISLPLAVIFTIFAFNAGLVQAATDFTATPCSNGSATSGADGECQIEATKYQMIFKGFRLRNAVTREFVIVSDNVATYDFSDVNANEFISNYISSDEFTIPNGTYDAVSPILENTMIIQGSFGGAGSLGSCATDNNSGGEETVATSDDASSGSDAVEGAADLSGGDASANYINGNGDLVIVDGNAGSFTVDDDTTSINFNIETSINYGVEFTYSSGSCVTASTAAGPLLVDISITVN